MKYTVNGKCDKFLICTVLPFHFILLSSNFVGLILFTSNSLCFFPTLKKNRSYLPTYFWKNARKHCANRGKKKLSPFPITLSVGPLQCQFRKYCERKYLFHGFFHEFSYCCYSKTCANLKLSPQLFVKGESCGVVTRGGLEETNVST